MDNFDYNDKGFIDYINEDKLVFLSRIIKLDLTSFVDICVADTHDNKQFAINIRYINNLKEKYKATKRDGLINHVLDDTI